MKHVWHDAENCRRDADERCVVCEGGLADCIVCGAAECQLTTDCPGEHVDADKRDTVCAGALDYTAKHGWHTPERPNQ